MNEFLDAVWTVPFIQRALLTGVLASVACGVVGTYVVVRRISYLAGGIAHSVLGGMGAAVFLRNVDWKWTDPLLGQVWANPLYGRAWVTPLTGAIFAAIAAAVIIGVVSLRFKQREDTAISALWAVGMAAGVLFIAKTPGYQQDLASYLFGNILMVTRSDLWLIGVLDAVVVGFSLAFYKQLLGVCFDEEFARTRGVSVEFHYLLLLCLTALTVVLLVTVVGIIMVIALLSLPVAVAGMLARRLWQVMVLAVLLSAAFTTAGLAFSYGPDLPAGATTILLAGGVYLAALLVAGALRRVRGRT